MRDGLVANGIDVAYVTSPVSVRYLTGFTGSNGQVVVRADDDDLLVTDARYDGRAERECPDVERRLSRDPQGVLLDLLPDGSLIAFETERISHAVGRQLERWAESRGHRTMALHGIVSSHRRTKEPSEIARVRRACALTDEAVMSVWADVRPGMTERDLARRIVRRMEDLGADGPAFPPIVASGPNGAVPHHEPGDRELRDGDLVTIDAGALVEGYHADWTRTLPVGRVAGELVDVHAIVCEAQAAGRAAAVAGVGVEDLDEACRAVVRDAGYGEAFVHGAGHGVGLEIHEAPMIGPTAAEGAAPGSATVPAHATVTVEPGIYLPGRGGVRIEDLVLVTPDGPCDSLTTTPRPLHVTPEDP